jgi:DNA-binding LacI/PurR family transcriptional regulator
MNLVEVARRAKVSTPTVSRICEAINFLLDVVKRSRAVLDAP